MDAIRILMCFWQKDRHRRNLSEWFTNGSARVSYVLTKLGMHFILLPGSNDLRGDGAAAAVDLGWHLIVDGDGGSVDE